MACAYAPVFIFKLNFSRQLEVARALAQLSDLPVMDAPVRPAGSTAQRHATAVPITSQHACMYF